MSNALAYFVTKKQSFFEPLTPGLAKWNCVDASVAGPETPSTHSVHPQWYGAQPDMSDCKSVAMSNLEAQVRKEDPENVLISSLSYVTR